MQRMRQPAFRAQQARDRYDPHVRAINVLIDELIGRDERGWMPHVAPVHGGVHARVLTVLRDPGKKTLVDGGSGFLCVENDDDTARTQKELMAGAGVTAAEMTPWNAYPWYINAKPAALQLEAGVEPLRRLLELLPDLRVVLLQGGEAHDVWRRFSRRHPDRGQGLEVIETYHPGRRALLSKGSREEMAAKRAARQAHRRQAWLRAGEVLNRPQSSYREEV
ncbi:uracil-DNA glycosylase [Actinomycetospora atypica]|uniref:Uracil-DNA glycosylase n=1 Tax=Actinomycetospora atypica TaxID=1290095 RepID=A0ABV9YJ92_9PSEU